MYSAVLFNIEKSKVPKLAPSDFKKRKAVEEIESNFEEICIGSGVKLEKHPLFNRAVFFDKNSYCCSNCNSINTLCIYFSFYNDNVSKQASVELECYDCHYFSQFEYRD
jgi:hypothetical protein